MRSSVYVFKRMLDGRSCMSANFAVRVLSEMIEKAAPVSTSI